MQTLDTESAIFQLKLKQIFRPIDLSNSIVPQTVKRLKEYNGSPQDMPEVSALEFYYLNHAMAELGNRKSGLSKLNEAEMALSSLYADVVQSTGTRLFYYLLLICTREARHEKQAKTTPFWLSVGSSYGNAIVDFMGNISGVGSTTAVEKFKLAPPAVKLGPYTAALCHIFYKGDFHSSYGGQPWGDIANCLASFVHGKTSLEAMIDTAFTLCHNNGPIFNKGMYFQNYTSYLYKILDVQRSGQIPQLVHSHDSCTAAGPHKAYYNHDRHITAVNLAVAALGNEFGGSYVDWFLVEELGALHQYKAEQAHQVKMYGKSKSSKPTHPQKKDPVATTGKPESVLDAVGLSPSVKVTPNTQVELVEINRE